VEEAIKKLLASDSTLNVQVGNILDLQFVDQSFDVVLAYGLYHNLESKLDEAIKETARVLKKGGRLCASFRIDNICNLINDKMHERNSNSSNGLKKFHKLNLTKKEYISLLENNGFEVQSIEFVTNMPLLYKFKFFRKNSHKQFDESLGRKEGYLLNPIGNIVQTILKKISIEHYSNVMVAIANKK
jgi:ubiquinone/menaquinone biosynthesis C-methylase UbiE